MKFTEEQYQKIVGIADEYHDDRRRKTEFLLDYMYDFGFNGGEDTEPLDQALALANPLTRELAHEQYVEVKKKYVWTLKKVDKSGIKMRLYKDYFGRVQPFFSVTNVNIDDNEKLTETGIREWGYNPDMFDKEEVK